MLPNSHPTERIGFFIGGFMSKLVYGAGLNDADYAVSPRVSGKTVMCPFYQAWKSMLQRCYSPKWKDKYPTYINCSVCDEWLTFSNFKAWMEKQGWKGKHLDKDILFSGNKVYSADTCVFVDSMANTFTTDCGASRGEWPIGVYLNKREGKFQASCSNPITGMREHLGFFTCPNLAHQAWKKRKHELACQLADLQTDDRVANSLRSRYA